MDSKFFVQGKVSGEFTFPDSSEVSEISASVDDAAVSLLGEYRTSSADVFPDSSESVSIPSRCTSRLCAAEQVGSSGTVSVPAFLPLICAIHYQFMGTCSRPATASFVHRTALSHESNLF